MCPSLAEVRLSCILHGNTENAPILAKWRLSITPFYSCACNPLSPDETIQYKIPAWNLNGDILTVWEILGYYKISSAKEVKPLFFENSIPFADLIWDLTYILLCTILLTNYSWYSKLVWQAVRFGDKDEFEKYGPCKSNGEAHYYSAWWVM